MEHILAPNEGKPATGVACVQPPADIITIGVGSSDPIAGLVIRNPGQDASPPATASGIFQKIVVSR